MVEHNAPERDPLSHYCETCTTNGRQGYCAPLRCYCGHQACHAFASYVEPVALDAPKPSARSRAAATWAAREDSTWIDKL